MRRPSLLSGLLLAVLLAALPGTAPVDAQSAAATTQTPEGDGLIVRVQSGDLVFIDRGADQGIARGDLFDVISSEVLVHPLSDSILAVTPKSVGALEVLQVYARTSLARLLQLDAGEDPMLKPIVRIRDPERVEQIERLRTRGMRAAAGMDVSRRVAVVPGLYQLRIGETRKGWALMGAEAAILTYAVIQRSNSNTWYDEYKNLSAGLAESEYTRRFEKAQDFRTMSNRLFWLAGALYIYNWVDVMWLGDGASIAQASAPSAPLHVGLGWDAADLRTPLLRLTHRF